MKHLSVVSPVYNTAEILPELVTKLTQALSAISDNYEIILVDDDSPDQAWEVITNLGRNNHHLKGIKLSRNFGQHCAIAAGMDASDGEFVIVMDSDLQDRPEAIGQLYQEAQKGFPIVIARRDRRTDGFFRKLGSRIFYYILSKLSNLPADHSVANFGIYHISVVKQMNAMREKDRYFPMMVNWVGFPKRFVLIDHGIRSKGGSGYSLGKLLRLAFNTTITYSDKPLRYVIKAGFYISLISVLYGIYMLIRYFSGDIIVLGYTSLILSVWFLGGIILFTLGMVGVYVGKTFEGIKNRPLYIIEKQIN